MTGTLALLPDDAAKLMNYPAMTTAGGRAARRRSMMAMFHRRPR